MKWLVCTPVWGTRHHTAFELFTLPALLLAAKQAKYKIRFLTHTDDPDRIAKMAYRAGAIGTTRPLPQEPNKHLCLGLCNRDGIAAAEPGDIVALVNADMVPSVEFFEAAERRFAEGKKLVMMAGTRTLGGEPPVGAASADLLRWTMFQRHPTISACFYGEGHSRVCSTVYFRNGADVVLHAWHLQTAAFMVDRPLSFNGATADDDLANCYQPEEIHVVTDANEAAFAEMSPIELAVDDLGRPMDIPAIVDWARNAANQRHAWFFRHRITIMGNSDDGGDRAICDEVLARWNRQ